MPFSLKDDTNTDFHLESETTSFELVKKYMRVVDADIVNNDAQKDNVKHLQGAVRLIRRAAAEMNPVLNLLNIFCTLFLGQQDNEMLEEEICNDYEEVIDYYTSKNNLKVLDEYADLLISHAAIDEHRKDYLQKLSTYIQLKRHLNSLKTSYLNTSNMIDEKINKTLSELEANLRNVESARKQVESTVNSYEGIKAVTANYVKNLSSIENNLHALITAIGADYEKKH